MRSPRGMGWVRGLAVIVVLLGATLDPSTSHAQPLQTIFEGANQAHFEGDHERAARMYERLVAAGVEDPDVSYNLGITHTHLQRYGAAIVSFERTLELRPSDTDAERSLALVRAALGRQQAQTRGEATVETRPPFGESLVRPFSEDGLAWLVLLLDLLFFSLLISLRWIHGETGRLSLGIALPLVGLLLLLSGTGLAIKTGVLRDGEPAIVVAQEAQLREGPDPRAEVGATALEGERALVVDRHGQWLKVRLGGDRHGWARSSDVDAI